MPDGKKKKSSAKRKIRQGLDALPYMTTVIGQSPTTREIVRAREEDGIRTKDDNIPGRSKDAIRSLMDTRRSLGKIVSEKERPSITNSASFTPLNSITRPERQEVENKAGGGKVRKYKKGGFVGDGRAIRGRTKGRMV